MPGRAKEAPGPVAVNPSLAAVVNSPAQEKPCNFSDAPSRPRFENNVARIADGVLDDDKRMLRHSQHARHQLRCRNEPRGHHADCRNTKTL